ncbi:MAG: glycoside hydrolase family 2 protein, partial [Roseburia sp.]|nr:glycoside hydrolase family 2 protein [Roseburia sp.]
MKRISWGKDWTVSINGGEEQAVTLPHDAMQQLGRDKDSAAAHAGAYYRSGVYTYRKKFVPPADWSESEVILEIEGVYPNGKVLLNGTELGKCSYGYLEYRFPMYGLTAGRENTLEVIVDHSRTPDSRWYSGGGLYRPVSLLIGNKSHIAPGGIKIKTVDYREGLIEVSVDYV